MKRLATALLVAATGAAAAPPPPTDAASPDAALSGDALSGDALVEAGRRIYREGVLSSGEPLRGLRPGGVEARGADAACVLCHQRSGMGIAEGAIPVPPVAGPALFGRLAEPGPPPRRAPGMEFRDYAFRTRPPYDDETLARAIRDGINPGGHAFHVLMPRYALAPPDMRALTAYLRALSAQPSPGVEGDTVHFATVVAPGVAPARRAAFLDVLRACFAERHPEPARDGRLAWHLSVWELRGEPADWAAQLAAQQARRPVFAVVSGLGLDEWTPVERFCESSALPCLFPNVDVPGSAPGWYTFHFFRGVALEADVLAHRLRDLHGQRPLRRVLQVHRAHGRGAHGARALREALADSGIAVESLEYRGADGERAHRPPLREDEAVALWLEADDLAAFTGMHAPPPGPVLLSGLLAGLEDAPLPPAWKAVAVMAYPYDPPARWHLRRERNLRPWLAQQGIARADERLQGNTLAACNVLAESMLRLRGQPVREHLVEWVENYPSAMGNAPAPQAFARFSLGPGQRFSSKGAWLVRFASPQAARLAPVEPDWIVP
jgi:hypothetical protein